jgi:hypothetical protein
VYLYELPPIAAALGLTLEELIDLGPTARIMNAEA